ncbi:hypothetical protein J2Y54_000531 [Sphingomonas sp. BE123]|nr:hypothetical protein [Sphingomonas sp. BE123]
MIGAAKGSLIILMLAALACALLFDRLCGNLPTDMTGAD